MASELATGMLIINVKEFLGYDISMLVTANSSKFHKKGRGKIIFRCDEMDKVKEVFSNLNSKNQTDFLKLKSKGYDSEGDLVSEFTYEWSLKRKF